jgi:probable phosphoglycerate mutase
MTTIYLIRHGEITQSTPRRFVGRQDLPLTGRGRSQIADLAEYLSCQPVSRVLSSPLARCRESAAIICNHIGGSPEIVQDLTEITLGAWEGLSVAEVKKHFPGCYGARGRDLAKYRPLDGESFADLLVRVWPSFFDITKESADLVIVAHAGVNRVILGRILAIPLENILRLEQDYGCLNIIHSTSDGYRVECINCRPSVTDLISKRKKL